MLGASVDIISRPPSPLSLLSQGCHHQNQMIGSSGHNTVTLKQHSAGLIDFLELQQEKSQITSEDEIFLDYCKLKGP